jgi:signal transduction histidine kinase/DNA-binding response OmpR family regulator
MEIISDINSNLIIFTERHGVFKVSNDVVVQVLAPEVFADDIQIYDAILSSDGFYYVGSTYSGLFILDSDLNIVRHYLEGDGVSMDTVFSVNEDMQGNIWLTGIFELSLNQDASAIVNETKLLDVALGRPLVKDKNGYIVASSSNGAFLFKRQNDMWEVDDFASLTGPLISVTRDKNDTLWLGSPTSELFKLANISRDGTKEVNEKVELLRQQQILKDRFFSNVSHEFRTPLTLTIGPLETLMLEHAAVLTQPVTRLAKTALNNASRMLALVGQVLDLNRLEAGKLPLRIAQYDVAELLRNISERFESWAGQHQQQIQVVDCEEPLLLWFDLDQFDKCVSNLLSNAIKYSGENSTIQVQLLNHGSYAEVFVRDNGVGISEGAKNKVFERFYQDKSSENVSEPGTGIGLALVKEIMEIHHGDARLCDDYASKEHGCCFVLTLKSGNQHFASEQIIEPIDVASLTLRKGIQVDNMPIEEGELEALSNGLSGLGVDDTDVTTLLIVEDNKELLNFISLRLSASYRIIQAMNGQEGYQKACETLPDLIISDVNMPIMTGLELAQQVKASKLTQTIPIILLTAKATKREVVAGFSVGADDYLTKPFDTSELLMRVNAQIKARKLVRSKYAVKQAMKAPKIKLFSLQDKINAVIEEQLVDPSFNVEKLAALLHMSRDTLIRKCKKECGDTPLNLIVQMRMQRADELLKQQTMSVSEVAYACGFESLAYFSNRYKKHRGISPSEVSPS